MKRKPKTISKEKAIVIASNHNNIPIQIAKGYTESELREVSIKASEPKARLLIQPQTRINSNIHIHNHNIYIIPIEYS